MLTVFVPERLFTVLLPSSYFLLVCVCVVEVCELHWFNAKSLFNSFKQSRSQCALLSVV